MDIETIGIESTSGILSLAAIYHDETLKTFRFSDMVSGAFFVKFDIVDQLRNYGRTSDKDTMAWWEKQGEYPKRMSFIPRADDKKLVDGLTLFSEWMNLVNPKKNEMIWVRGSLDQPVIESAYRAANLKSGISYNHWRDVRTFIDTVYSRSNNGYVDVDTSIVPDYNFNSAVKHDPVQDVALDICMMCAGVSD